MHLLLAVAVAAALLPASDPPPRPQPPVDGPSAVDGAPLPGDVVPGRFVVVDGGGTLDLVQAIRGSSHGEGPHVVAGSPSADPRQEARRLTERLGRTVLPMVRYRLLTDPAGEPYFPEQWALENTGQEGGVPGADVDARPAWRWTKGGSSVVAVVDSGVDPSHHELAGRLWTNPAEVAGNGIDDDGNGLVDDTGGWDFIDGDDSPDDAVGHGTAVAGIVAAAVDGAGITGIAPEARVMVVKACDGSGCPADAVASGIVYAADNGADVVNLSLGAQGYDPLVEAAVEYASERGLLVVAAAGNSGVDVDGPVPWTPVGIDDDALVGVGWSDRDDRIATQSNFGATSVDLVAPGTDILAPTPDGLVRLDGTSFSTPHVSGVAAMVRSIDPGIAAPALRELLIQTSDPIGGSAGATSGGGRLNAAQAVYAARFRDIPHTTFADDVMWAAASGITKGCNPPRNDRFCPSDAVTRGQMAAFLVRALGLPPVPGDYDPFTDDDDSVFGDDVERLAQAGITRGCTPTRFCPSEPVTRGQMAAFLVRAFALPPGAGDRFSDDDGSVFEDDIERLAAAGVTRGCADDLYCPRDPVTRGQMAAFLRRAG